MLEFGRKTWKWPFLKEGNSHVFESAWEKLKQRLARSLLFTCIPESGWPLKQEMVVLHPEKIHRSFCKSLCFKNTFHVWFLLKVGKMLVLLEWRFTVILHKSGAPLLCRKDSWWNKPIGQSLTVLFCKHNYSCATSWLHNKGSGFVYTWSYSYILGHVHHLSSPPSSTQVGSLS